MKNQWKRFFFGLLLGNILILGVIIFLLTSPFEQRQMDNREIPDDVVPFMINTNKADLAVLINQYLTEQSNGFIDYQIVLDDYVNLYGTFPVFEQNIEMKVAFEPVPLENGDLILKEKEISIGKLQLPSQTVLKIVNERYQFPEWVNIEPDKKRVYVDLQNMKLKGDLQVKVNKLDLKQDQIQFTLFVPIKK